MKDILLKEFVGATPRNPLNRIAWNCVVMKDMMCRYAYQQERIQFFSWNYAFFEFRNFTKMKDSKILLKQFVIETPLKPLNRISWNINCSYEGLNV